MYWEVEGKNHDRMHIRTSKSKVSKHVVGLEESHPLRVWSEALAGCLFRWVDLFSASLVANT